MKEVELETARQFLRHFLAFERLKLKQLGCHREDIVKTDISRLNKFVISSKGFDDL